MSRAPGPIRVLQSFPHKIGAARICTTAWEQAAGPAEAGANVLVFPGAVLATLPPGSACGRPWLAATSVSHTVLSGRCVRWSCTITSSPAGSGTLAARSTSCTRGRGAHSRRCGRRAGSGIPTVLERPNAHTRFAYEVVRRECERLGIELPPITSTPITPRR